MLCLIYIVVSVTLEFLKELANCCNGFSMDAICTVAAEVGTLSHLYNFFGEARTYKRANNANKPEWRLQLQFSAESFASVFRELEERVSNENSDGGWPLVINAQLTKLRLFSEKSARTHNPSTQNISCANCTLNFSFGLEKP